MSLQAFQQALASARRVTVLTGAGVSAESGMPTFRGAGGLWRRYDPSDLATPEAFTRDPSLVWEWYHWRREMAAACRPNPVHYALAALQRRLAAQGRQLTLVTQNVDRLHQAAGSMDVLELHGSIWDVCPAGRGGRRAGPCYEDRRQPLAPALAGRGAPDDHGAEPIPAEQLPRDAQGRLLRPGVVWFGESLPADVLQAAEAAAASADLLLVVGTSAVVWPAAGLAHAAAARGGAVAEFNLEPTEATGICRWAFHGKAGELLPAALGVAEEVRQLAGGASAAFDLC